MSTIEDRLSSALSARAELVNPEDLRAAGPPAVVVPFRRRPATWLVAAAASAAVVIPLLVFGGDGEDRPTPPVVTPTAPVTPNGDEVPGANWKQAYTYPNGFDVDGDGVSDEVVIRTESDRELPPGPRRLEAHLSTGGVTAVVLDYDTYDLVASRGVDLDGDGGDEIVYYRGTKTEEIGVLRYADDGALHDLEVPADPGITNVLDDQGRIRTWYFQDAAFYSTRSFEGGFVEGDGGKRRPAEYEVELWSWSIVDQELRPVSEGTRCVQSGADHRPFPCGSDPTPIPGTQPEATEQKAVGEAFDVDVDADGADDVVALEGPTGQDTVADGEVLLVVSLGGGGELSAPVPAGPAPAVFTTTYAAPGPPGLLVEQASGDSSVMTLYVVRGDTLVAVDVLNRARFGNGVDGETRYETWLTTQGRLLTRSGQPDQVADDFWQFFGWGMSNNRLWMEDSYGMGCWEC